MEIQPGSARRLVLEFDPHTKTRAASFRQQLVAFALTSGTGSFEIFDKECHRLKQVTGIEIQDEVKCALVTLHMQHEMLRQHLIMHASRLDTSARAREEVHGTARQNVTGILLGH